ncbi:TPA: hypothetical protein MJF83_004303 [Clostridioides difficile]|nr:hypothetical protein [Clostridioides difficile]HBF2286403.1 hypothetical protein [Clostridioides difficile]HBF3592860.1 hypothetical protein [Clostridioides difficile]HBF3593098.1 hypothetical protein [Clostridioides difficile]HBF5709788.1 hypothetical protein [Clostridioides difficile]
MCHWDFLCVFGF